jgi:glucose/arabinose dehydrogenase
MLAALLAAGVSTPARATLDEPGFRAVPVALAEYPIAALAAAPDGRMFAAVQALGSSESSDPVQAEIRVYSAYASTDGAILDEGQVWATVDAVRATNADEGLLGIALAPDFVTSGLVYVYLTTTDGEADQHLRVYRENALGFGELVGTAATALEPPVGSSLRNGGGLAFGVDGCLYVGVGDNSTSNRWNSQVLQGTDSIRFDEQTEFCTDVCLGPEEYPDRSDDNGLPNQAGKVLRLDVEGAAPAQGGAGEAFAANPSIFGTGFIDPVALGVHPLTGQLYVVERGENLESELNVADSGGNHGWPCLQGSALGNTSSVSCLSGAVPGDVYAQHPDWRRPIATHSDNSVIRGPAAYTGYGYPAEYFGDMFYVLRDGARIYRLDLAPPCFMPDPAGMTPIPFHDSSNDNDFNAFYDSDDDGDLENVGFRNFMALAQGPNPMGQDVLYLAARQSNSSSLTSHSIIFRLEYATTFTPYQGGAARVDDSCYTQGPFSGGGAGSVPYAYENPFRRQTCLPPGGFCPSAPDGTPCDDGDVCNGADACLGGICRHGLAATDGTSCDAPTSCRAGGSCEQGTCVAGSQIVADGTPCPDNVPCNGLETCLAGTCQAGTGPATLDVRKLTVKRGKSAGTDAIVLSGRVRSALALAPATEDDVTLELSDADALLYGGRITHPQSNSFWGLSDPPNRFVYKDRQGLADGIIGVQILKEKARNFAVKVKAKRLSLPQLTTNAVTPRVVIGDMCFEVDLDSECRLQGRKLKCR